MLLPAAALATPAMLARHGPTALLPLWAVTILMGGAVEAAVFLAGRRGDPDSRRRSPLARWVLRLQGNTSLIAVALSAVLIWYRAAEALPGVWLLLLGHSFYLLGGLALPAFRPYGLLYQAAGIVALWPGVPALGVFAVATGAGNLWMAWAVWRARRR